MSVIGVCRCPTENAGGKPTQGKNILNLFKKRPKNIPNLFKERPFFFICNNKQHHEMKKKKKKVRTPRALAREPLNVS